jgi:hypothetical protein
LLPPVVVALGSQRSANEGRARKERRKASQAAPPVAVEDAVEIADERQNHHVQWGQREKRPLHPASGLIDVAEVVAEDALVAIVVVRMARRRRSTLLRGQQITGQEVHRTNALAVRQITALVVLGEAAMLGVDHWPLDQPMRARAIDLVAAELDRTRLRDLDVVAGENRIPPPRRQGRAIGRLMGRPMEPPQDPRNAEEEEAEAAAVVRSLVDRLRLLVPSSPRETSGESA